MKIEAWLKEATKKLKNVGVGTARLDALVLLEDELNITRAQLLAEPERKLTITQNTRLSAAIERRMEHEPLAYIRGKSEFYGSEFFVNKHVLEPRPESETMIELLKTLPLKDNIHIADVGAGSGAIGIIVSLEFPNHQIDLIEISFEAIKVAKKNVIKFATDNLIIKSDLLAYTNQTYDVLLCNLPYVPESYKINLAAAQEPKIAIFGGPDGLDVYRQLFDQIMGSSQMPKYILTESLPPQHSLLTKVAVSAGYKMIQSEDFIQVFELR